MDFVTDSIITGRRFRALAIVDDYSRECPAIEVDTSLGGRRVVGVLEKLLEKQKALESQITEEKAKDEANKVLASIGADVATVVSKATTDNNVDIKVLHGKFFALTVGDNGKLTVEVVNKARGNGSRTSTGNGNGNGNFEYYLKDNRGPFESVQKAMDELGIPAGQRPTRNRYDRLSADWQDKIVQKAKAQQPASGQVV